MQLRNSNNNVKKLDSYSLLIVSKYFKTYNDYINIVCVNSKFKETTEKLRFNPIPITSLKLFPKIQTQYLYKRNDTKIYGISNYEIWYKVNYDEYLKFKKDFIKCHSVIYTSDNRLKFGNVIPEGVTEVSKGCFLFVHSLISITLPFSIKSLGISCFFGCVNLDSIILQPSLTSLSNDCFNCCNSLKTINLSNLFLTSLGNGCFSGCKSLKSIDLPSTISSLGCQCFNYCISLTTINLPYSLIKLGKYCFKECTSLKLTELPSTITSLGENCFSGCNQLRNILNIPEYCFENPDNIS